MELTRWRTHSDALEKELALLKQKPLTQSVVTPELADKTCATSESTKTDSKAASKMAVAPELSASKDNTEQEPSEILDNKSLDDLLLNGELEKALNDAGNNLEPEKRGRLMTALSKLKESSLLQNNTQYDASDPEYLRSRIDRSIRILEVNRVFEHELGMGVSQFLNSVDPSAVEDVSSN